MELRPGWLLLSRDQREGVRMRMVQPDQTDRQDSLGAVAWTPAPLPPMIPPPVTLAQERTARRVRVAAEIVSHHVLEYLDLACPHPDMEVDESGLKARVADYVAEKSLGCGWHASE